MLTATWSPGKKSDLLIETTIIAPTQRWPDWYIRVHNITRRDQAKYGLHESRRVEGGFAVSGRRVDRSARPRLTAANFENHDGNIVEGFLEDDTSSLIVTSAGASGILQLSLAKVNGEALKLDANTNLMFQRPLIPTIKEEQC